MSSLYQKRGLWYYAYYLGGKRRYKALQTKDDKTAKRAQKILDGQFEQRRLGMTPTRCSVEEGLAEFMTAKETTLAERSLERYQSQVARISAWLKDLGVDSWHKLTSDHAEDFVRRMNKEKLAPKTVADVTSLVRSILRWLWKTGRISEISVREWPTIKARAAQPDRLGCYSDKEIEALLEYFQFREFRPTLAFAAYTGARREEIRLARVGDVRLDLGVVVLINHKTETTSENATRSVRIHPKLLPILVERVAGRKREDILFPELRTHSLSWPHVQIRAGCKALNIQYRRFHGIRHTFVSHLLAGGADLREVMAAAGHTSIETTAKYLHKVRLADTTKLGY